MKNYIFIISFFIINFAIGQDKETVYILFDSKNDELCEVSERDRGRYHDIENTKMYLKSKSESKNHLYRFYICKELFLFDRDQKMDTCNINYLKKIKISKIEDLKNIVDKVNPLYPNKVFKKVFLVEKINDSIIVKYDVKWKYYIE